MYKTEFLGENLIDELSKIYCKGKSNMKKTIYLIISLLIILSFPTETYANSITAEKYSAIAVDEIYGPKPLKVIKLSTQAEKELACSQTSNVTVLNSKQVKIKYEFWIVKFFKKLFTKN